jgi:hypothetical protein
MRVLFINNHGGGFADYVEVAKSITVAEFFSQQLPGCPWGNGEAGLAAAHR